MFELRIYHPKEKKFKYYGYLENNNHYINWWINGFGVAVWDKKKI